jgi:hypothetical protein
MSAPIPRSRTEIGRCGSSPSASASRCPSGASASGVRAGSTSRRKPALIPGAFRAEASCSTAGCLSGTQRSSFSTTATRSQSSFCSLSTSKTGPGVVPPGTLKVALSLRRRLSANSLARRYRRGPASEGRDRGIRSGSSANLPPTPPVPVQEHQRLFRPELPGSYCAGRSPRRVQPSMIGSVQAQAASTSSPRMNSVWLPRITSMISRS